MVKLFIVFMVKRNFNLHGQFKLQVKKYLHFFQKSLQCFFFF